MITIFYLLVALGNFGTLMVQRFFYVETQRLAQPTPPTEIAKQRQRLLRIGIVGALLPFASPLGFMGGVVYLLAQQSLFSSEFLIGLGSLTFFSMLCQWVAKRLLKRYLSDLQAQADVMHPVIEGEYQEKE